ncbi:MAG: TfoX/Sxy family protein [Candidatus Saccharimonadales bacterium]
MAYNQEIAEKVRQALKDAGTIEQKQMFGSLGFMVNGKLAIAVGADDVMYKIGPELTTVKIDSHEAEPVTMNSRTMKSWVFVKNERLENSKDFNEWLAAALDYNRSNT